MGAPRYDAALWNAYNRYEANNVPESLLFGDSQLFPIDMGPSVESMCYGPSRPFPSQQAQQARGACEYEPSGRGEYSFWQKLPGDRLRLANCYCYATDQFQGSWCYPGLGSGMGELVQTSMDCADLSSRVQSDGGKPVARDTAVYGPVPSDGHYIALFYRPQWSCNFARCAPDFHFMRRDSGGAWSQKQGEAPVTDKDDAGKLITDPEAATLQGGYTEFCGYFHMDPSKLHIGTDRTPDRVNNIVQRWRDAGLAVRVTPLPYNPSTDDVDEVQAAMDLMRLQRLQQQQQGGGDQQQQQRSSSDGSSSRQDVQSGGRKLLRG